MTAAEIRAKILSTVSANGGHLASSLGAVELAMALAHVFRPTHDRIVWDVGHQAYAWKILTGRAETFATLRQLDGVSPFPLPVESAADAAVAGHAGVALSVVEGLAAARDLRGGDEHVVAVVGDGALVNGISFEAVNNASSDHKVILVLNDNEMSISRPAGAIAKVLGRLITNIRYNRVKKAAEAAGHRLRLTFLRGIYHTLESRVKSWFLANAFFEMFGFRYVGPVDGHDLAALEAALVVAKEDKRSVIVHVVTKKGRGYAPAEKNPTKWHGVGPFAYGTLDETIFEPPTVKSKTWSDVFGETLVDLARKDERIVALTAGMRDGTGLTAFAQAFPNRFFDVGIAEEHMVAFAAGLAAGGLRPFVAVYSTFLQRAVDQVMHDVCLPNLPVVLCVDRAGVVGQDGATHQGLYDYAMLKCLPNLTIMQPCDADDLKRQISETSNRSSPTVIRYPRGVCPENASLDVPCAGATIALWVTGDWLAKAQAVAARVPRCCVVPVCRLKPFDRDRLLQQRAAGMCIVSLENAAIAGGFGETIGADIRFGWPDLFVPHGKVEELEKRFGLDVDSIVRRLRNAAEKEKTLEKGNI